MAPCFAPEMQVGEQAPHTAIADHHRCDRAVEQPSDRASYDNPTNGTITTDSKEVVPATAPIGPDAAYVIDEGAFDAIFISKTGKHALIRVLGAKMSGM